MYGNMQVCKYASMQVCKYASTPICKYVIMQIFNYSSKYLRMWHENESFICSQNSHFITF